MTAQTSKSADSDNAPWQPSFMELLPILEKLAAAMFRHLTAEAKDDAVSEVVAGAMCAYQRLHQRGQLHRAFATALARFAAARYFDGRRVGTPQCSGDVYSPRAKRRAGFDLQPLAALIEADLEEILVDKCAAPIPETVAIRIEFPRWLSLQDPRNQRIVEHLILGLTTGEVARVFGISPARVSQLRRQLAESWRAFAEGRAVDERHRRAVVSISEAAATD